MRSLFEIACKRCNSKDGNSAFEAVVGELRATLLRRGGGVARVRIPHHVRGRICQNVDSFSHNRLFSPSFTQWVCTLAATPPQTTPAPPPIGGIALHELHLAITPHKPGPPIGGNCTTRGFDTPATRRKRASCSAKPPIATNLKCAASPPRPAQGRLARNNSPNTAPPVAFPRNSSPSTAPPVALPRKSSPSTRKNAEFGPI